MIKHRLNIYELSLSVVIFFVWDLTVLPYTEQNARGSTVARSFDFSAVPDVEYMRVSPTAMAKLVIPGETMSTLEPIKGPVRFFDEMIDEIVDAPTYADANLSGHALSRLYVEAYNQYSTMLCDLEEIRDVSLSDEYTMPDPADISQTIDKLVNAGSNDEGTIIQACLRYFCNEAVECINEFFNEYDFMATLNDPEPRSRRIEEFFPRTRA